MIGVTLCNECIPWHDDNACLLLWMWELYAYKYGMVRCDMIGMSMMRHCYACIWMWLKVTLSDCIGGALGRGSQYE